jgi:hypothetical protein
MINFDETLLRKKQIRAHLKSGFFMRRLSEAVFVM